MIYCYRCGKPVETPFCGYCGTQVPTEVTGGTAARSAAAPLDVVSALLASATYTGHHDDRGRQPGSASSSTRPSSADYLPRCPACGTGFVTPSGVCNRCGWEDVSANPALNEPGRGTSGGGAIESNPAGLPPVSTTVVVTLLFGLFGMIPASLHTAQAAAAGAPTDRYWKAFGAALAGAVVLWLVVGMIAFSAAAGADHALAAT